MTNGSENEQARQIQQRQQFIEEAQAQICPELFSLFGDQPENFSATPTACQVVVAINIIAKLSFWIKRPYLQSIMEALKQFRKHDYVQKLKTHITSESVQCGHEELAEFLYKQVMIYI